MSKMSPVYYSMLPLTPFGEIRGVRLLGGFLWGVYDLRTCGLWVSGFWNSQV